MNRAIFLDRDGVIDDLVLYPSHGEWEAPRSLADLQVRTEVFAPLKKAQLAGWLLFLISNQPSYAKGKCSLAALQEVQAAVMDELKRADVRVTEAFVCFHHPESTIEGFGPCECRKPQPFFLLEAAKRHGIDLPRSWMVGDQDSDVVTGINAGCRTALIKYDHSANKRGDVMPDLVCSDLAEFVRMLER